MSGKWKSLDRIGQTYASMSRPADVMVRPIAIEGRRTPSLQLNILVHIQYSAWVLRTYVGGRGCRSPWYGHRSERSEFKQGLGDVRATFDASRASDDDRSGFDPIAPSNPHSGDRSVCSGLRGRVLILWPSIPERPAACPASSFPLSRSPGKPSIAIPSPTRS